jgi:hypothetical protein
MPRSNRPRRSRGGPGDDEPDDLARVLYGRLHTESKRDGSWNVQSLSASNSVKEYVCPGCRLRITPGTAHTVAWRADGLMGEADDVAARRHWHNHCWKIK